MPLNNRQESESYRLKGVNLFDDPIDVEFGAFTELSNWITVKLYSLSKKRGVASVPSGAQLPISPCQGPVPPTPVLCGLDSIFVCGEELTCSGAVVLVLCGSDTIMICGELLVCGTTSGSAIVDCDGAIVTGLGGSETTCA